MGLTLFIRGERAAIEVAPTATNMQCPALQRNRTLSATTNPTRNRRFDAGRNGRTSRDNESATNLGLCKHTVYTGNPENVFSFG